MYQYFMEEIFKGEHGYNLFTNTFDTMVPSLIHTHDFYEIFIVKQGHAYHYLNQKAYLLEAGTMWMIFPSDVHYYQKIKEGNPTEFMNIVVPMEEMNAILTKAKITTNDFARLEQNRCHTLDSMQTQYLLKKLTYLEDLNFRPNSELDKAFAKNLVEELVLLFFLDLSSDKDNTPHWLRTAVREYSKELNYVQGIDRLVELSGKSTHYLFREFKKYLNMTPSEYTNRCRLNRCLDFLLHTEMSILDVALTIGYNNLSYFNRIFKEKYGITPSAFRRRYRNESRN